MATSSGMEAPWLGVKSVLSLLAVIVTGLVSSCWEVLSEGAAHFVALVSAMISYTRSNRREAAAREDEQVFHCAGVAYIYHRRRGCPTYVSDATAGRYGGEATGR